MKRKCDHLVGVVIVETFLKKWIQKNLYKDIIA